MKLSKIVLKENVEMLSNEDMKEIKGGSGYCHCKDGKVIEVAGCSYEACDNACGCSGVQNCNYSN